MAGPASQDMGFWSGRRRGYNDGVVMLPARRRRYLAETGSSRWPGWEA